MPIIPVNSCAIFIKIHQLFLKGFKSLRIASHTAAFKRRCCKTTGKKRNKGGNFVKGGNLMTALHTTWCLSGGRRGTKHAARSHISALAVTSAGAIKQTNCGINKGSHSFVSLYDTQLGPGADYVLVAWKGLFNLVFVCRACCAIISTVTSGPAMPSQQAQTYSSWM